MTQFPLCIFLCMVAFAGGLFCILSVVGLFWLLSLNVIARTPEVKTTEPTERTPPYGGSGVTRDVPVSILPLP